MRIAAALLALCLAPGVALGSAGPAAAGPFSNWAAIDVAGDFHAAHTQTPTETFDNARRDVAAELIRKASPLRTCANTRCGPSSIRW